MTLIQRSLIAAVAGVGTVAAGVLILIAAVTWFGPRTCTDAHHCFVVFS
ncbi:MAG: hypothetical protein WDM86_06375 [Rhizomicrobium sp.]